MPQLLLPPPPLPPPAAATTTTTTTTTLPSCHVRKLGFFHRFFIVIRWDDCLGKLLFIWLQKSKKILPTINIPHFHNNIPHILPCPIYVIFCHDSIPIFLYVVHIHLFNPLLSLLITPTLLPTLPEIIDIPFHSNDLSFTDSHCCHSLWTGNLRCMC